MSNAKGGLVPAYISRQVSRARRFYFGQEEGPGAALEVRCGGWELVASDYTINRASFPWIGLEFVAGGRGRLRMRGVAHELKRGSVFAYGPGVPHQIETDSSAALSKYYVDFSGREAKDLMSSVLLEPGECRQMDNAAALEKAFDTLIEEGVAEGPRSAAIAALQLRILLLKLTGRAEPSAETELRSRRMLRKCVDYLDKNFLDLRTAEEAAAACHVSIGHMTRSFARHGYGSPYRYLTRKKMLHAAALIDAGSLMVREVADRLGMDPFQFSRVFKRVHGISPSDFARRHGTAR